MTSRRSSSSRLDNTGSWPPEISRSETAAPASPRTSAAARCISGSPRYRWSTLNGSASSVFQRSSHGLGEVVRKKSPRRTSLAIHSPPSSRSSTRAAPEITQTMSGSGTAGMMRLSCSGRLVKTCASTSRHGRPLLDATRSPGTRSSSASAVLSGVSIAEDPVESVMARFWRFRGSRTCPDRSFDALGKTSGGSGTSSRPPASTLLPSKHGVPGTQQRRSRP